MTKSLLFENVPCGRCGGSGRYSFNLMHGSVCYGCNGAGVKLTKRGRAAQALYTELLSCKATELKVGDTVRYEDYFAGKLYFCTVSEIRPDTSNGGGRLIVELERGGKPVCSYGALPDTVFRKGQTAEFKKEAQAKAFALQNSLNKLGKPLSAKALAKIEKEAA